jgi:SnoaL-like protein
MANMQEISDHIEIVQVTQRYAKALDEKRFDLLRTVFTEDAQLVYLIGKQLIEFPMREADKTFKAFLTKCYWTSHLVSDPVIELQGDRAHASSRVTATHLQIRVDGSRNTRIISGAYEDELVRSAEGWRIRKRVTNAPYEQGVFLAEGVREFRVAPSAGDAV